MQVSSEGSVRVDLVGGTLDIFPLNLIIPNAITLNVATSLKARVTLTSRSDQEILIRSQDYQKDYQFPLNKITETKKNNPEMKFILELIELFKPSTGMLLELASGAPAGSGLGGSSAMGVTLYKALSEFFNQSFDVTTTVAKVKDTEAKILNQGVPGYQDYYPALMGGVLALKGAPGEIVVEQLYNEGLKNFLEDHITLVFSGVSRQSGINNWEVYKGFFDQNKVVQDALYGIADISEQTYQAICKNDYAKIPKLIGEEGQLRTKLAPTIVPAKVLELYHELKQELPELGLKMCGAGGGGCFIFTHHPHERKLIQTYLTKYQMTPLDFIIQGPLNHE